MRIRTPLRRIVAICPVICLASPAWALGPRIDDNGAPVDVTAGEAWRWLLGLFSGG
jgi:hypothetical protein